MWKDKPFVYLLHKPLHFWQFLNHIPYIRSLAIFREQSFNIYCLQPFSFSKYNFLILPLNKVHVTGKMLHNGSCMCRLVFLSSFAASVALRIYGSENFIPSSYILSNSCLWSCAKCALSGHLLAMGFIIFYQNTMNSVNKFHEYNLCV